MTADETFQIGQFSTLPARFTKVRRSVIGIKSGTLTRKRKQKSILSKQSKSVAELHNISIPSYMSTPKLTKRDNRSSWKSPLSKKSLGRKLAEKIVKKIGFYRMKKVKKSTFDQCPLDSVIYWEETFAS